MTIKPTPPATYPDPQDASVPLTHCKGEVKLASMGEQDGIAVVQVCVYRAVTSMSGDQPVCAETYQVSGDDFSAYFSSAVLDGAGVNPTDQAQLYILNHPDWSNWEAV